MKYEKSCGAIVFNEDKILVIKRVQGHWGFPKGHVEGTETEVETAAREIKEETNLDVEINQNYRYVERYYPKSDVEKDVVYFVAKKTGGDIVAQEEEVQSAEWVDIKDAMGKLTYESSKNVLRKAINDLKLNVEI